MLARYVLLALGLSLAVAIVRAAMPQPHFRIKLVAQSPRVVRGRVKSDFLDILSQLAHEYDITRGTVSGFVHNRVVRLRFSREFPAEVQQRLRNSWGTLS
jgi:hypothetical protein